MLAPHASNLTTPAGCRRIQLMLPMIPCRCFLQAVGHVVMQPPHTTPASSDKTDAPAALYAPAPGVLVCCCSSAVAPERAPAWARGIIQELQPQRFVLLGSMQVGWQSGCGQAVPGPLWSIRRVRGVRPAWPQVRLIDRTRQGPGIFQQVHSVCARSA